MKHMNKVLGTAGSKSRRVFIYCHMLQAMANHPLHSKKNYSNRSTHGTHREFIMIIIDNSLKSGHSHVLAIINKTINMRIKRFLVMSN